mgnify:CR=1 FL=1
MELLDFYKGKRVLVTGDTGFKGSWLVRILHLAGAEVTGYALKAPTEPSMFEILHLGETIHHVDGDVRDFAHLKQVFDETKPEIVLHLDRARVVPGSGRHVCGECHGYGSCAGMRQTM